MTKFVVLGLAALIAAPAVQASASNGAVSQTTQSLSAAVEQPSREIARKKKNKRKKARKLKRKGKRKACWAKHKHYHARR